MREFKDGFISSVMNNSVKKEEALIRSVHPNGISDIELAKRCKWISNVNQPGIKTLYLDEDPVLTLHDPKITEKVSDNGSVVLKMTQDYVKHV